MLVLVSLIGLGINVADVSQEQHVSESEYLPFLTQRQYIIYILQIKELLVSSNVISSSKNEVQMFLSCAVDKRHMVRPKMRFSRRSLMAAELYQQYREAENTKTDYCAKITNKQLQYFSALSNY